MISLLLVVGVLVAMFVAFNIGGSTTGPAFGPAVGAGAISKPVAAGLMGVFFFLGAWTLGRNVVTKLGSELVVDTGVFTLTTSITVLFFIGVALLVGNVFGVPASTSMTAVGAIAGLGLAGGVLDFAVMGEIVVWWVVSPIVGFWVSLIVGRYVYDRLDELVAMERSEGPLFTVDRSGSVPVPRVHRTTNRRELAGTATVVGIGCLMAFSSGTSNIANAVAPLVGSGNLAMNPAIALGGLAVTVGAFTIARRTLETMGSDITELPLTAAIVVAAVSSTLVVFLSALGIPASFVIIATMSVVGLGWGRATRRVPAPAVVTGDGESDDPLREGTDTDATEVPNPSALFDPLTTARIVLMQNVVPVVATVGAYLTFRYVPIFGF
ncbi:anion permease [Halobaculum sp. MBLA0147]|uniref:inorganic phosphate transporter n=1 Tax=Halobaculum sp. MBLA0147 TaxID=3079934 RepID=UPI0035253AB5